MSGIASAVGDLTPESAGSVGDDPEVQLLVWRLQRLAWLLLAGFLLLSLVGLSGGGGPLARATAGDERLSVDYPRILRRASDTALAITIAAPPDETVVLFDAAFHDIFAITEMSPGAASSYAYAGGVAYRFETAGRSPVVIRLTVVADRPGRPVYGIVVNGRRAFLDSLILP